MNIEQPIYDIIISGGSNLGLAGAIAIHHTFPQWKILLIESSSFSHHQTINPSVVSTNLVADNNLAGRSIAINQVNLLRFSKLKLGKQNLLQNLAPKMRAMHCIFVKQQNDDTLIKLTRDYFSIPQFGGVIHLNDLNQVLSEQAKQISNIEIIQGRVEKLEFLVQSQINQLQVDNGNSYLAHLTLIAAGEDKLGLSSNCEINPSEDYALVAQVNLASQDPPNLYIQDAIEYFTSHGPIALLPQVNNSFALVWCDRKEKLQQLNNQSLVNSLNKILQEIGVSYKVTDVESISAANIMPLRTKRNQQLIFPNLALIGNAATQVHPVSGQGYNLGLDSLFCLLEQLKNEADQQSIISINQLNLHRALYNYQKKILHISQHTFSRTSLLAKVFSELNPITINGRRFALALLSSLPALNKIIVKPSLGIQQNICITKYLKY